MLAAARSFHFLRQANDAATQGLSPRDPSLLKIFIGLLLRMNILAVSHTCVTDVYQKLFLAMDRIPGVNVQLLVPANWIDDYTGKPITPKVLDGVNFPIHQYPVAVPGNISLHFYTKLPRLSDLAVRPDVILSTQEPWSFSGLQAGLMARKFGVPFLFQMNQNIFKRYPPPFPWIEQFHFRTGVAGLPCTEEAREVLLRKGMKIPSEIIPFGTDIARFKPGTAPQLRAELGIDGAHVVGYMGRLVPEKGVDILLKAAAKAAARSDTPVVKVLIVGSGPMRQELEALAETLGIRDKVVFAGSVAFADAGRYLQCMDTFVLPSRTTRRWKEQFGRVLIEAMACGIPVLGSDSGSIPSVVGDAGGGLIFQEDNVDECADAIARLACDSELRNRLSSVGVESVRERYTFDAVAQNLAGVIAKYANLSFGR